MLPVVAGDDSQMKPIRHGKVRCNQASDIAADLKELAGDPAELATQPEPTSRRPTRSDSVLVDLLGFVLSPQESRNAANLLLNHFGTIQEVFSANQTELRERGGVDYRTAKIITKFRSLTMTLLKGKMVGAPVISNWSAVYDYLLADLGHQNIEHLRVIYLDSRYRVLSDDILATGTFNHVPVYPREILKRAIILHAASFIVAHNHPSGDATPSRDDVHMTRLIVKAAAALDITLLDHFIVADGQISSLRKAGLLE